MKLTKQQLKKIIKEELEGILAEMGPEFPGEDLPRGGELDQALDATAPLSREEKAADLRREIAELEDSFQGLGQGPETGFRGEAANRLNQLYLELQKLEGGM